jgi:hypothetical protein
MASNFAFHPTVSEVVPFSAQYSFPNQSTRQSKRTVKLTPKNNAARYRSGTTIRFEFPASGYLNPNNTYLAFNARTIITSGAFSVGTGTTIPTGGVEFQQNIQSIFRRVRVLYGSLVLEDIQDYNLIQRIFTEIVIPSGTSGTNMLGQGIGPSQWENNATTPANNVIAGKGYGRLQITRSNYHTIQPTEPLSANSPTNYGEVVRRYAVPINTGLFQQKNLIPLKYMASQLQLEIELAEGVDCITWVKGVGTGATVPTGCDVEVALPELVTELLEFDSEFDAAIYDLLGNGLPIHFTSWHTTTQTIPVSQFSQLNIQESSRSVKYALAVLLDDSVRTITRDAHRFYAGLGGQNVDANAVADVPWQLTDARALIENYQWRLGGTYYPSQPIPVYGSGGATPSIVSDSNYADPPVEAYQEVTKVFGNMFGEDGVYFGTLDNQFLGPRLANTTNANSVDARSFIMVGNFMSDRGDIINGINAEEQNDLQLLLKFNTPGGTAAPKTVKIIVAFDNLVILGESNNMVLVN